MDIKDLIGEEIKYNSENEFYKAYTLAEKLNPRQSILNQVKYRVHKNSDNIFDITNGTTIRFCGCEINLISKDISFRNTDISINTLIGKLEITRVYDTKLLNKNNGDFGIGFTHNFNINAKSYNNKIQINFYDSQLEFSNQGVNKNPRSLSKLRFKDSLNKELILEHEGLTYFFNKEFHLIKLEDNNNNFIEVRYKENTDLIHQIITSCGKYLTFEFKNNKIISITDNSGRKCRYFYDKELLISVVLPNNGIYKYEYHEGKIAKIINPNNNIQFQAEFNRYKVLKKIYKGLGKWYDVVFDERLKEINFILDKEKIIYKFDRDMLIKNIIFNKHKKDIFYDENNNVIKAVEDEIIFEYEFNEKKQYISKKYKKSDDMLEEYYFYNENNKLNKVVRSSGYEKIINYDKRFNIIEEKELLFKGFTTVTKYTYDSKGRLIQKIDGNKNKINYIYDSDINLYPDRIEYPNKFIKYLKYDELNRVIEEKEFNKVTRYKYNNLDKLIQTVVNDSQKNFILYDYMGNLKEMIMPKSLKQSEEDNTASKKYTYIYDEKNNLVKLIMPDGKNYLEKPIKNDKRIVEKNKFNYVHKVLEKYVQKKDGLYDFKDFEYDKNLNLIKVREGTQSLEYGEKPSEFKIETYEYDNRNNLSSVHSNSGKDFRFTYIGIDLLHREKIKINYETDYVIIYEYNDKNLLNKKIELLEFEDAILDNIDISKISNIKITTSFEYDENNNLVKIFLPGKEEKKFNYNINGKPENKKKKEILSVSDKIKKLLLNKDAIITTDKFDRIIKITYSEEKKELFEYDLADNISKYIDTGNNVYEYFYNSINRIKKIVLNEKIIKEYKYNEFMELREV